MVICGRNEMTVVIARHVLSSLDLDNIYLADGICKASYNATHVYVTTGLNDCGTMYSETGQKMYFNNTLTGSMPIAPGAVITRKQSFSFGFRCAYSRLIRISGFKFEPPKQEITFNQSK